MEGCLLEARLDVLTSGHADCSLPQAYSSKSISSRELIDNVGLLCDGGDEQSINVYKILPKSSGSATGATNDCVCSLLLWWECGLLD